MSTSKTSNWLADLTLKVSRYSRRRSERSRWRRLWLERLHFEPLETRALLASILVTSLADDTTADGQVTLARPFKRPTPILPWMVPWPAAERT